MEADTVLTNCPRCSTAISFGDVIGQTELDDGTLVVGLVCPFVPCRLTVHFEVDRSRWQEMLGTSVHSVSKDGQPVGAGSALARQIGREVKGFRVVELAPLRDVGDLLLVWEDQERWSPESVPREFV